jgi:PAS domain S-box-containing protein
MSQKPAYADLEKRVKELEKAVFEHRRLEEALRENAHQAQIAYDQAVIYAQELKEEIAERKRTEKILRESEEKFRSIYEQSPIGIELYDTEGCLLDANKSCLGIFGVSDMKEVKGFRLFEDPNVSDEIKQSLKKGETVRYQAPFDFDKVKEAGLYYTSKSKVIFLDIIITPLGGENKSQPLGYLVQIQDITDRIKAEEALKDSEEQYRTLVENSHDMIFTVDLAGNFLFANKGIETILGYSMENTDKLNGFQMVHPDDLENVRCGFKMLAEGNRVHNMEYRYLTVNGSYLNLLTNASPVFDTKGNVTAAFGIAKDITYLKEAKEALQRAHDQLEQRVGERTAQLAEANEQLKKEIQERDKAQRAVWRREEEVRMIAENAPALISYVDAEGIYTFVNKRYEEWFGIPREDVIGRHYRQVLGEAIHERINGRVDMVLSGKPVHYEDILPHVHGGLRWVTVDYVPDTNEQGKVKGFFSFVADITERVEAKKALETQLQLEQIVAAISSSFINMEPGEIDDGINLALETIGGFSRVDRSYVFLFRDNNKMDNTHEWCAPGIASQIHSLQGLSADTAPWWMARLNAHENIHIPSVAALPREAGAEKRVLQSQDIQSLIAVPLVTGGSLLGFIGFDSVRIERTWTQESIILLQLTAEILANALLRKWAEERLNQTNEALMAQAENLETLNNALTVLLDRRDKDKEVLEEKVVSNIRELVLPYVETLKRSRLDPRQAMCISIVESNLQEIISPFLRKLSTEYQGLTPKEIQVAALVKQGKTTKEIAELFNVSPRAVQFHRHNIRKKLGLKSSPTNLGTYLLSLS